MLESRKTNLKINKMKKEQYFSKPVIAASGVLGFSGEGYWHYKLMNIFTFGLFGYILRNWITFQSKTTTAFANKGNAELANDGYSLKEKMPNCVAVNFIKGFMVNNFSLSGPGLEFFLKNGLWVNFTGEFHISVMLIGKTAEERIVEAEHIVMLLQKYLYTLKASKIFLNWNISCPNTGHDVLKNFLNTFNPEYEILSRLKLPILVKVGWNFPIDVARKLQELEWIKGFVAINTIPFNELPGFTKKKYFTKDEDGEYVSPLDKYQDSFYVKGRGGVSGHPERKFSLSWITKARQGGIIKPIIGGGGIMNPFNVWQYKNAGATLISIGTAVSLRFWNLPLIILVANVLFKRRDLFK